jgi:hypothetical protein
LTSALIPIRNGVRSFFIIWPRHAVLQCLKRQGKLGTVQREALGTAPTDWVRCRPIEAQKNQRALVGQGDSIGLGPLASSWHIRLRRLFAELRSCPAPQPQSFPLPYRSRHKPAAFVLHRSNIDLHLAIYLRRTPLWSIHKTRSGVFSWLCLMCFSGSVMIV